MSRFSVALRPGPAHSFVGRFVPLPITKVSGNYTTRYPGKLIGCPRTFSPKAAFTAPRGSFFGTETLTPRLMPGTKGSFASRATFVAPSQKVSGSFTRYTMGRLHRGALGNFVGKPLVQSTTVDLAVGHFTFTPLPFSSILQDTVIDLPSAADESYTAIPFTIEQGGNVVDLSTASLTFTPQVFQIEQQSANDHIINLPVGHITFTPVSFSVIHESQVDMALGRLSFTPYPIDVSITLPGPQTLTQTDILAIWQNISVGGYTPQDALGIIASAVAGRIRGAGDVEPGGGQTLVFRSLDNTKDIITANVDVRGNRVTITLTP